MGNAITRNTILKSLNTVREEVRKKFHVRIIGLFGSYARGTQKKRGSDIDILIDPGREADLFDIAGLSVYLEHKLGRKVDIVPARDIRKELKETILSEVIRL